MPLPLITKEVPIGPIGLIELQTTTKNSIEETIALITLSTTRSTEVVTPKMAECLVHLQQKEIDSKQNQTEEKRETEGVIVVVQNVATVVAMIMTEVREVRIVVNNVQTLL